MFPHADKALFKPSALSPARVLGSSPYKVDGFNVMCDAQNKFMVHKGDIPKEGIPLTNIFGGDELGIDTSGTWLPVRASSSLLFPFFYLHLACT
jgi:hypothetical protein